MGDHRCSIKIEMEFHGVKDHCDMWINYGGETGEVEGVDDRVIKFIRSVYNRGMEKYNDEMDDYYEEQHKEETEKKEKAELERLKKKYESEPKNST